MGKLAVGESILDLNQIQMLARPVTIYSGTNEIQRNIIARTIFAAG